MSLRYRPEIDGLRSVAIVSVLIYHLKIDLGDYVLLRGGFLGVDVFFVISGYLIASIILSEHARTGRFSYATFYERRARRLLPALLCVLAASAAVGWVVLLPSGMVEFGQSALASIFFLSNVYWDLISQQYGAQSGLLQPLLHTWSLAVEEQFYLIFPTLFLAGLRWFPGRLLALSCAVVACGLVLAEILTRIDFSFSFYWLVSRVWEMMAGAALAQWAARGGPRPGGRLARALPGLGLALILGSILTIPVGFHHPGLATVGAVGGAVLIIGFAAPGEPVTRLLSSRPLVAIGLISYSLYLWHYPIYAFGRLLRPEVGPLDYAVWLALSFGLAVLSYRVVEQPFRDPGRVPLGRLVGVLGGGVAAIGIFAAAMLATDGMRARLPGLIALYGPNDFDNSALAERSWGPMGEMAAVHGMAAPGPRTPTPFEQHVAWFDPDSAARRVLVVGDSHSKDMFNVLRAAAQAGAPIQVARYALPLPELEARAPALWEAPNFRDAELVVLSYRFFEATIPRAEDLVGQIRARGKEVALFDNTVEFPEPRGETLFDLYLREAGALDGPDFNRRAWERRALDRVGPINDALHAMAARAGVKVYEKAGFMCDAEARTCDLVTPDGYKTLYDYGHYTLEGARHFGDRVAGLGWFAPAGASRAAGLSRRSAAARGAP